MLRPLTLTALLALTLVGGLLWWTAGVTGASLWLDEAWSVLIARACNGNPLAVFDEAYRVDNNHPLLTFLVVVLGAWRDGETYRLAVALLTVPLIPLSAVLAARVSPRGVPVAGLLVACFSATCFAFLVYGTEVRGYGIALCAAIAAWVLAFPADDTPPTRTTRIAYAVVCSLGVLAHFSFVQALGGLILADLFRRHSAARLLKMHGPPVAVAVVLFFAFVGRVKIAGAGGLEAASPLLGSLDSAAAAVSLLLGGPWTGYAARVVGTLALVGTLTVAFVHRGRGGSVVLGAWAVALVLVAGKSVLLGRGEVIFPRYFLIAAAMGTLFALTHLAASVADLRRSPWRAVFAAAALAAVIAANLNSTYRFLTQGQRGEYLAPLQVVAASPEPTLASDYDSRTLRLENYYRPWLPGRIRYQPDPATAPQWYLLGASGLSTAAPAKITRFDAQYRLHAHYPHFGPSGWTWSLYAREPSHSEPNRPATAPGG